VALTTFSGLAAVSVHAQSPAAPLGATDAASRPAAPSLRDDRQYVYSLGLLARVTNDAITLRFDDGQIETYGVDAATTIHTPNGDVQHLADLQVGQTVLVITEEHAAAAVTIVNGGDHGFPEDGPYDIGENE
jgi:hypothetical protein